MTVEPPYIVAGLTLVGIPTISMAALYWLSARFTTKEESIREHTATVADMDRIKKEILEAELRNAQRHAEYSATTGTQQTTLAKILTEIGFIRGQLSMLNKSQLSHSEDRE